MLRRIATLVAVAAVIAPAFVRANEWEEDYSDQWRDDSAPPSDDYPVSVDVDASASVTFDTFQGALSPYGEWVVAGSYGRVWRPHVAAGWRPYYYGRWEWTNEGWLWVSDEPWGWAAYHYGRWNHDPYYGWVWVPGYQWAPAWVSWRYSGDVVGWAPLAPGVSVYVSVTPFVDTWWTFVPCNNFAAVPVYRVAYAPELRRGATSTRPLPRPARPAVRRDPAAPWLRRSGVGPSPRTSSSGSDARWRRCRVVAAPLPGCGALTPGRGRRLSPRGARPRQRTPPGPGWRPGVAVPQHSRPGPHPGTWQVVRPRAAHLPHGRRHSRRRQGSRFHARSRSPRRRRPLRAQDRTRSGDARRSRDSRGAGLDAAAHPGAADRVPPRPQPRPRPAPHAGRRRSPGSAGPGGARRARAVVLPSELPVGDGLRGTAGRSSQRSGRSGQEDVTRTVVFICRPVSRSRALMVRMPSTFTSKRISSRTSPARQGGCRRR